MGNFIIPIEIKNTTSFEFVVRLFDYIDLLNENNNSSKKCPIIYGYYPDFNYNNLVATCATKPMFIFGLQTNINDGRKYFIEKNNINKPRGKDGPYKLLKEMKNFEILFNGYNILTTTILPNETINFYFHVYKQYDQSRVLDDLDPIIIFENKFIYKTKMK